MSDRPKRELDRVAATAKHLQDVRDHLGVHVRLAVAAGATWADIGEALGTSRQAAWERFGKG